MSRKRKSIYTVKEATRIAFNAMDTSFHSIRLCQAVRELTARPFLMDGTILRRLRELRENEPAGYDYVVVRQDEGLYRKVKKFEVVNV